MKFLFKIIGSLWMVLGFVLALSSLIYGLTSDSLFSDTIAINSLKNAGFNFIFPGLLIFSIGPWISKKNYNDKSDRDKSAKLLEDILAELRLLNKNTTKSSDENYKPK